MCKYDFISYGLDDGINQYLEKYNYIVKNFEEAFDDIVKEDNDIEEYN